MADGRSTKIFMPSDLTGIVSSLGLVSEALGIGNATPVDDSPKEAPAPAADPCLDNHESRGSKDAAESGQTIAADLYRTTDNMRDL